MDLDDHIDDLNMNRMESRVGSDAGVEDKMATYPPSPPAHQKGTRSPPLLDHIPLYSPLYGGV